MERVVQDIRVAARSLLRRPGFTAVAVLTLGLGVAASTTMFSVLYSVVLKPLPYADAERLVRPFPTVGKSRRAPWTGADFLDFAEQSTAYESVAAFQYVEYSFLEDSVARMVAGVSVTPAFFQVLGVPAQHGRTFTPSADSPGGARVAVLGNAIWSSRFAADPGIVGRAVDLNGEPFTVVGIMPPGFEYPEHADIWVASRFPVPESSQTTTDPSRDRSDRFFHVIARLRPDIAREQARQEGQRIIGRLAEQYPETNRGMSFELVGLHDMVVGPVREMLLALFGAAALVLLVACANVANLLLVRAAGRSHEMAIRASLGAGRRHIVRQLLGESLLVGLGGGGVGVAMMIAANRALAGLVARDLPRAAEISVSVPVFAFALGASLLSSLFFGLAPALWLGGTDLENALRQGGHRAAGGTARSRLRSALVTAEMAVSLILLVGVGLLLRTLTTLGAVDPGFSERQALTAQLWLPGTSAPSDDELRAFHAAVLERVRALPGVVSAGAVLSLPIEDSIRATTSYSVEGRVGERGSQPTAGFQVASPDYFASLGIPILKGRAFDEADGPGSPAVMVISQAFAESFFPGEDPIGKRIGDGHPEDDGFQWCTVVGVAGSTRHSGLGSEPRIEAYRPLAQSPTPWISLVLKTSVPAGSLSEALRRAVAEVRPSQPVERVLTMEGILRESLARQRLQARLLAAFAALALVLAAVGLYGLMAFSVTARAREIGIRVAVGAGPADIVRLVLHELARLLAAGLVVGGLGSLVAGRLMRSFLHGIPAADPPSFAAAALTLSLAALAASLVPALHALRTDPNTSLRSE